MKKTLSIVLAILLTPIFALGAIAFDNSYPGFGLGNLGGGNPASIYATMTVSSSAKLLIACGFIDAINTGAGTNRLISIQAGTSAGTSTMTLLSSSVNGNAIVGEYYLLNPPTGTVGFLYTVNDTNFLPVGLAVASYTGVNTSSFPDSFATPTGPSATTFAPSTTVVGNNAWLATCSGSAQNSQLGVGAGTTVRSTTFDNGNNSSFILADSNSTVGTGSQALNLTSPGGAVWNGVISSFIPAAVAATTYDANSQWWEIFF